MNTRSTWIILFSLLFHSSFTMANETCSRVAQINFQNILVDTNSHKKGEGLRYHLEKDPLALSYLNKYQEGTKIRWENALIGTLGTALLLGGAVSNAEDTTKRSLMISGGTLVIVNYLIAKTLEKSNEKNLAKAIDEYNKRNLPRIYFSPGSKNSKNRKDNGTQIYLEKNWNF